MKVFAETDSGNTVDPARAFCILIRGTTKKKYLEKLDQVEWLRRYVYFGAGLREGRRDQKEGRVMVYERFGSWKIAFKRRKIGCKDMGSGFYEMCCGN